MYIQGSAVKGLDLIVFIYDRGELWKMNPIFHSQGGIF